MERYISFLSYNQMSRRSHTLQCSRQGGGCDGMGNQPWSQGLCPRMSLMPRPARLSNFHVMTMQKSTLGMLCVRASDHSDILSPVLVCEQTESQIATANIRPLLRCEDAVCIGARAEQTRCLQGVVLVTSACSCTFSLQSIID